MRITACLPACLVVSILSAGQSGFVLAQSTKPSATTAPAAESSAAKDYQTLFGAREKAVLRTAATRDDAELAGELFKAAETLTEREDLKLLLYEKAAALAAKDPAGSKIALEAIDRLAQAQPDRKLDWEIKRLAVYRQRWQRARGQARIAAAEDYLARLIVVGDLNADAGLGVKALAYYRQALTLAGAIRSPGKSDILARIRRANQQAALERRGEMLKAKLAKDPKNVSARQELLLFELVDRNRPAEARKLLTEELDEYVRTYVPMACVPVGEATETASLELARWYEQLVAKSATPTGKANATARAARYCERYLALHKTADMNRVKATITLERLKADLKKMGVKPVGAAPEPAWIDLLKRTDPARRTVTRSTWTRQDGGLATAHSSHSIIAVPEIVRESYDLQVVFTLQKGHESTTVLPVGTGHVTLMLGAWRGQYSGLSMIGGRDVNSSSNPTRIDAGRGNESLRPGVKMTLDVRVRVKDDQAQITAALNGKRIISWSGKQSALTLGYRWRDMPRGMFGLGTYGSSVVWHSMRLKRLGEFERNLEWVSRDAKYKPSSIYEKYPPTAAFVSGEGKLHYGGMAFQTSYETNPHVIVALKKPELVKRIVIENTSGYRGRRQDGLAVLASADGRGWTGVWKGGDAQPVWLIDLKKPVRAKYLKIGLPTSGGDRAYLGLAGVRVYAQAR